MAARPKALPERLHRGSGDGRRSSSRRSRSRFRLDDDGWLGNRPSRRVPRRRSGRTHVRSRQMKPRVVALDNHRRFNRLRRDRSARAADEEGRVGGDHLRASAGCLPLRASRERYAGWRRLERTRRLACGVETPEQRPGASVLRIVCQRFEHPHPGGVVRALLVRPQRPGVRRIPARAGWISHVARRCRRATCGRCGVPRNPSRSASLESLPEGPSAFAKMHCYRSATRSALSKGKRARGRRRIRPASGRAAVRSASEAARSPCVRTQRHQFDV